MNISDLPPSEEHLSRPDKNQIARALIKSIKESQDAIMRNVIDLEHNRRLLDEAGDCARVALRSDDGAVVRTGALGVSRALGDFNFKPDDVATEGAVSNRASVAVKDIAQLFAGARRVTVLLACDGLWDVFTPEGAFAYLEAKGASAQPQRAVQQLCKAAEEEYGSLDNITAVLVQI